MEFLLVSSLFALCLLGSASIVSPARELEEAINVPELHIPEMPKIPEVHIPKLHVPELPKMPELHIPELHVPEMPKIPKLEVPEIPKLPEFTEPKIPELTEPKLPAEIPHEPVHVEKSKLSSQQTLPACKVNFSKVDYTSVTSVCKAPAYDMKTCCGAFSELACKYAAHVNNFSSTCPVEFISFLNYAGNYPHGVFIDRCVTSQKLCSSN